MTNSLKGVSTLEVKFLLFVQEYVDLLRFLFSFLVPACPG